MNSSSKIFDPSGRGAVCTIAATIISIESILFGTAKAAEANLPMPLTRVANSSAPSNPPTKAEIDEVIVCAFFYCGYKNVNGDWGWWGGPGYEPPNTWRSHYIPNYHPDPNHPDSTLDPSVRLYDSLDRKVLEWQGKAMKEAGIKIAILGWSTPNSFFDNVLAEASRICEDVQWCIHYAPGGNSPQKIYDDIKWVLGRNSHNYAKIDGKWLVFVNLASQWQTSAEVQDAANKWSKVKEMLLANDGYDIFINADLRDEYYLPEHPWDAVHRFVGYNPTDYQHFSDTAIDDSACVFPGYWYYSRDEPALERSLPKFELALEQVVANSENYRFILTIWNNWSRGTQIESGQEIVQDPGGYYPSGYNYGKDFIYALASISNILPVHLEVGEMNSYEDTRIGASVFSPYQTNMTFTVRAKAMSEKDGNPNMIIYLNDAVAAQWEVAPAYGKYSAVVPVQKGIHKLEIGLVGFDGYLAVDYLRICNPIPEDSNKDCSVDMYDLAILASVWESKPGDVRWNPDYDLNGDDSVYMKELYALSEKWLEDISSMSAARKNHEGFETGDFSEFLWVYSGDKDWTITSNEKHSGTYSAKAGMIADDESSALELTLECISGNITFYRKVSSESYFDYLKFYIDGIEQDKWSGEQDWEEVSFTITPGQRTFKWVYSKDSSVSEGDDSAWIDDITFPIDD